MRREMLHIDSLTIGYKKSDPILSNISMSTHEGELICLMGPNGVGKTTLLRTLSGILPPLNGNIRIDGTNSNALTSQERASRISIVLTDPISSGAMTGLDVISMGRYPYQGWLGKIRKEDQAIINGSIEITATRQIVSKPISEMSDGQRQKILIARAVAQDCPIMILDEPNSHLDLNNRVEIMKMLKSLTREKSRSVLIATHELDLALQMADQIWLIDPSGELRSGIPEDLVLSDYIDEAFKLKGFDLKTGRVDHSASGKFKLDLQADGYLYLWTKNALERNGISIDKSSQNKIIVHSEDGMRKWEYVNEHGKQEFTSIGSLLEGILV